MKWWTNLILNTVNPVFCTFGAAADVRLNECWAVQPKLPALHIWPLPEQIRHLLNDCLLQPPLQLFFLSYLRLLLADSFFPPALSTYVHVYCTHVQGCPEITIFTVIFKVHTIWARRGLVIKVMGKYGSLGGENCIDLSPFLTGLVLDRLA